MPTGYTSDIYDGKEMNGKEFIMKCARAFGALIEMKEDPLNAKIPEEFKPNDYYLNKFNEVKNELRRFQDMTAKEAQAAINEEYNKTIQDNLKIIKEKEKMKNRYLTTLKEVIDWQPPTEDHINLKEFAIQQLKNSISHDCEGYEKYYSLDIEKETSQQYIERNINRCLKNIDYYTKEYQEETERINERNKWIKNLRDSFL